MFTGETGSGKTMLLGALGFAIGGRTTAETVRRGTARTVVTLEFDAGPALRERFELAGFSLEPDEDASLARELSAAGKSVLRLNGRVTTAAVARDFSGDVAEIVGQHEAQRLLSPAFHGRLLDRSGGEKVARAKLSTESAHGHAEEVAALLKSVDADERQALENVASARENLADIEAAALTAGEDDVLTQRRRYLDNVERIAFALRAAHEALAGDDTSASASLGVASASLRSLSGIAAGVDELGESAAVLQSETSDLAGRIARELYAAEFDPNELERINARLDVLDRIKRKYGGSVEAALLRARKAQDTIDAFESRDARRAQLQAQFDVARDELEEKAKDLSRLRRAAAKQLRERLSEEFSELGLGAARLEVALDPVDPPGRDGAERVEFLFAANRNDTPQAFTRVASGGELSRLLLALIVSLAESGRDAALIFDEIDAGIGGATATAVGVRLGRLARAGQIVCVTHLAQIATWADRHYLLEKSEAPGGAQITVREIATPAQRTSELARMLSGETHDAALHHARTLLEQTRAKRDVVARAP